MYQVCLDGFMPGKISVVAKTPTGDSSKAVDDLRSKKKHMRLVSNIQEVEVEGLASVQSIALTIYGWQCQNNNVSLD